MRAGLAKSAEASSLMVYRLDGTLPQHSLPDGLRLQVAKAPYPLPNGAIRTQRAPLLHASETLAEAELVRVQTLVYAGVWIVSLRGDEEPIIHLLRALLVWAAQERLDEVGVHCMADPELPAALWRAGFIELGSYYQFSASRPGGLFGVPDVPDGAWNCSRMSLKTRARPLCGQLLERPAFTTAVAAGHAAGVRDTWPAPRRHTAVGPQLRLPDIGGFCHLPSA